MIVYEVGEFSSIDGFRGFMLVNKSDNALLVIREQLKDRYSSQLSKKKQEVTDGYWHDNEELFRKYAVSGTKRSWMEDINVLECALRDIETTDDIDKLSGIALSFSEHSKLSIIERSVICQK